MGGGGGGRCRRQAGRKGTILHFTKRDIFSPQLLEMIFLSLLLKGQFHEESFQTETVGR